MTMRITQPKSVQPSPRLVPDILRFMNGRKDGWYDYDFVNPVTNKAESKTAFVINRGELYIVVAADKD